MVGFVNVICLFRHLKKRAKTPAIKNGEITTEECAVLLKMELKRNISFYPIS